MPERPARRSRSLRALAFVLSAALLLFLAAEVPASAAGGGNGNGDGTDTRYAPAPPWSQFQGGPAHLGAMEDYPGAMGGAAPEPPYSKVWTFSPGDGAGLSGPVISGDTVYATGEDAVYAFDLSSGEQKWSVQRDPGPINVPAVAVPDQQGSSQVLLYTQGKGEKTVLVGLATETEKQLWTVPLGGDSVTGVTVDGGTAVVADLTGKVYAVDVATGDINWSVLVAKGAVDSAPAVSDGVVYFPQRNAKDGSLQLVALDEESGQKKWETAGGVLGASSSGMGASPEGLLVVIGAFVNGEVFSLDPSDGSTSWQNDIRAAVSSVSTPSYQDGRMFASSVTGGLHAFDTKTGEQLWDFQQNGAPQRRSSPVVAGGYVIVGFEDGRVIAVNSATGHKVWQADTGAGAVKSFAEAPGFIVAGTGGSKGGLVAFRHDDSADLIDVVSPTEMDTGGVILAFAAALLVTGLLLFGLGRMLAKPLSSYSAPLEEDDLEDEEDDEEEDD